MSRPNSSNEKFERAARKLFQSSAVSAEEIEKIVGAPQLFGSIKTAVRVEQTKRREAQAFFAVRRRAFSFLHNHQIAAAFAVFITIFSIATVFVFKTKTVFESAEQNYKFEINQNINRGKDKTIDLKTAPVETAQIISAQAPTKNLSRENRAKVITVDKTIKKTNPPKVARKFDRDQTPEIVENQSPAVFYSLASGGKWENDDDDWQIVRAELSKSELAALGLNVPVAEDVSKIKTDLLIGVSGVPRAIRFVE